MLTPNEPDLDKLSSISHSKILSNRVSKNNLRRLAHEKSFCSRWKINIIQRPQRHTPYSESSSRKYASVPQLEKCARLVDQRNAAHAATLGHCLRVKRERLQVKHLTSFRFRNARNLRSFCKASQRLRALHGILFFKSGIQQELSIQGVCC